MRMMKAVQEQTTRVSVNTPRAWMRPCLTGWETAAVAAALGALPSPASLLNKPRFTPFIMAAPRVPPTACSNPKALSIITLKMWGTSWIFIAMTTMANTK